VATISDVDGLIANHIGFGSHYGDGTDFKRIKDLSNILDLDFKILEFTTPKESDVKGQEAVSISSQSGLSFIIKVMADKKTTPASINEFGKEIEYSTIAELTQQNIANYEKWQPWGPKPLQGKGIDDKKRSVYTFNPIPPRLTRSPFTSQDKLSDSETKTLKAGFENLKKVYPLPSEKGNKIVESTPMVHYFLSRYIASLLLPQAEESVGIGTKNETVDLARITTVDKDVSKLIEKAINLSPDVRTDVDELFDMKPIGSTIKYRDNDIDAIADNVQLEIPHDNKEIGLLQKIYSMMNTQRKNKFKKLVSEIIQTLPREKRFTDGTKFLYTIPTEVLEEVLVWIEEIELGNVVQQKSISFVDTIDLTSNAIFSEIIPVFSEIEMPGWMIMAYSNDGGTEFLQKFVDNEIMFTWAERDGPSGFESLIEGFEGEDIDPVDEVDGIKFVANSMAKRSYIGEILSIDKTNIEIRFEIEDDDDETEIITLIFDREKLLKNEATPEEFDTIKNKFSFNMKTPSLNRGLKSATEMAKFIEIDEEAEYGFELLDSGNSILSLAYPKIISIGDPPIKSDIGLSRAFQALGKIIMYQVQNNANKQLIKSKSTSQFDKAVDGLLGTNHSPGPASYHAQIQHDLLYETVYAALEGIEDGAGMVSLGANLVFEQYSKNPAKLMALWMMANNSLIDMGGFNAEGQPEFFTIPKTNQEVAVDEANLMNKLAPIIISYYRLAFFPLRMQREEFNLSKHWPGLKKDAKTDPPESYAFAAVLRFLTKSGKIDVDIPSWMPSLPSSFSALDDRARQRGEVSDFLSWSYGADPLNVEHFCEVAAAYHAAKALSYYKPGGYVDMLEGFMKAVEAERGEGFLISTLVAYDKLGALGIRGLAPLTVPANYRIVESM